MAEHYSFPPRPFPRKLCLAAADICPTHPLHFTIHSPQGAITVTIAPSSSFSSLFLSHQGTFMSPITPTSEQVAYCRPPNSTLIPVCLLKIDIALSGTRRLRSMSYVAIRHCPET